MSVQSIIKKEILDATEDQVLIIKVNMQAIQGGGFSHY